MKLIFKFFLLNFLLLLLSHAHGQSITKIGYNKFAYNGGEYKFQDMGDIFVADPDSYRKFQSTNAIRIVTNTYGVMTLTAISVGTLAFVIDGANNRQGSFCCTTGAAIGLVSWVFVIPITSVVGLVSRLVYNHKRNKLIRLFNNSQDIGYMTNPKQLNLKLGGGQYGYGIVINF